MCGWWWTDGTSAPWYAMIFGPIAMLAFIALTVVVVAWVLRAAGPSLVFDAFNEGAVRATAMLRSQPEHAKEEIRAAVRKQVEELREGDAYVIPVPAALSWARKP